MDSLITGLMMGVSMFWRCSFVVFYTPHTPVGEYYGFKLSVSQSVVHMSIRGPGLTKCPCVYFQTIIWVNVNGFSTNLLYVLKSGLGLMGKFHQFLTSYLPATPPYNLSKFLWIFTKLGMHRYCGDLFWDRFWADFVSFWQSYLPTKR